MTHPTSQPEWIKPEAGGYFGTVFETYPAGLSVFERNAAATEALAKLRALLKRDA